MYMRNKYDDSFDYDVLKGILRQMCRKAGSQKSWAEANELSEVHVSDVLNGRRDPGDKVLNALGCEKVVSYRRRKHRRTI